ncbi:MAG TPA: tRNA (adenosine(37)-N6)-dimethylallyltransferase MiaA [Candidatus Nanoarchaeia archaeon]|nr:tRNA (adenosine(37)-N6)-dimethylallyltransferase MiaA [Candidatus Nanoarchaeia archaeon]
MENKAKIIVILGTTASGKTRLAVALAREFNGEIISADSRQVYRGLDIGSGKDLQEYGEKNPLSRGVAAPRGRGVLSTVDESKVFVPHYLIDVADPKEIFSVAEYQKQAFAAIEDVLQRGKLPIIVGGSGQYLEAVVENYQLTEIKPDRTVRAENENKTVAELFTELQNKNSAFAEKLNNSDKNNKRRLIRYLEVANNSPLSTAVRRGVAARETALPSEAQPLLKGLDEVGGVLNNGAYDFLLLGLTYPKEILADRIHRRLIDRLEKENLIQEVSDLHDKTGLSWERLESFGLEYKFVSQYLQEKIDYDQMVELLERAINQFAKKQMTWFKRWEKRRKINWLKDKNEAENLVKNFLK